MAIATPTVGAALAAAATPAQRHVVHALLRSTLGVVAAFLAAVVSVHRAASPAVGGHLRPRPALPLLIASVLLRLTPAAAASSTTTTVTTAPAVNTNTAVGRTGSTARISVAHTTSTISSSSSSSSSSSTTRPIGSSAVGDTSGRDEALKRVAGDASHACGTSGTNTGRGCGRGSRSAVVADVEPFLVVSVAPVACPEPSSGPAAAATAAAGILVTGARDHYPLFFRCL